MVPVLDRRDKTRFLPVELKQPRLGVKPLGPVRVFFQRPGDLDMAPGSRSAQTLSAFKYCASRALRFRSASHSLARRRPKCSAATPSPARAARQIAVDIHARFPGHDLEREP
jgi:hypothetical protein